MVKTLDDIDIQGRRILVRVDFNVPLSEGEVGDDSRIEAAVPTLRELLEQGATLTLLSHLGRPKGPDKSLTMRPVAARLGNLLGRNVRFRGSDGPASSDSQIFVSEAPEGSVTLLENTRFDPRETRNDPELAKVLAGYGSVFVSDAFGSAHRAHASTEGVARLLPAVAGRLLERELAVLSRSSTHPRSRSRWSSAAQKYPTKSALSTIFSAWWTRSSSAARWPTPSSRLEGGRVGASLVEGDRHELARAITTRAADLGVALNLPEDSVCAERIDSRAPSAVHASDAIPDGWMGLDIGPEAAEAYANGLRDARTVLWNGPLGVFEIPPFRRWNGGCGQSCRCYQRLFRRWGWRFGRGCAAFRPCRFHRPRFDRRRRLPRVPSRQDPSRGGCVDRLVVQPTLAPGLSHTSWWCCCRQLFESRRAAISSGTTSWTSPTAP